MDRYIQLCETVAFKGGSLTMMIANKNFKDSIMDIITNKDIYHNSDDLIELSELKQIDSSPMAQTSYRLTILAIKQFVDLANERKSCK
jgi:hypothetical protein